MVCAEEFKARQITLEMKAELNARLNMTLCIHGQPRELFRK